jgi:hypothetical protein
MRRNIERAYDALWAEYQRIHRIHIMMLAQGDLNLERRLGRGKLDNSKYLDDELLDQEERFSMSPAAIGESRWGRTQWIRLVRDHCRSDYWPPLLKIIRLAICCAEGS